METDKNKHSLCKTLSLACFLTFFSLGVGNLFAQTTGEKVDVDGLKKKYWALGDDTKLGVVQDRYYTKSGRLQLSVLGGIYSGDPFFDTKSIAGALTYHLSEYMGLRALGLKNFNNDSSAYTKFVQTAGVRTNSNPVNSYFGGELVWSPLYGKLSLVGNLILYFDMHLMGGGGLTQTDNGNYGTGLLGVGQEIFLDRSFSVGVDFRWMGYREDIVEKVAVSNRGQVINSQMAYSTLITLGLNLYF